MKLYDIVCGREGGVDRDRCVWEGRRRGKVGLWRRRRGIYIDGECVEKGGVRVDGRMRN